MPRWFLSRLRKEFARSALRHVRWSSGQGPNAPFFSESGEFKLAGRSEIGRNATMRKGVGKSGGFKVLLLINTQRLSADCFRRTRPNLAWRVCDEIRYSVSCILCNIFSLMQDGTRRLHMRLLWDVNRRDILAQCVSADSKWLIIIDK